MNAGACCCFDEATLANRCPCQALPALHDVPLLVLHILLLLGVLVVVVVCQAKVKVKVVASRHELTTSLKTVSLIHVQYSFKQSPSLHLTPLFTAPSLVHSLTLTARAECIHINLVNLCQHLWPPTATSQAAYEIVAYFAAH